jgi:Predicted dehydrogenases and related proteins
MSRKKFAAVGTGSRISTFIDPIAERFSAACELVGLCDPSETRRTYHQQRLSSAYGIAPLPTYSDFDRMLHEQKPDVVIVCTPDHLHHVYIIKALEFGADVISEKPLTIDAPKYRDIAAAIERTGKSVRTTFNYRWTPGVTKLRQLLADGTIGRVKHVDFEYRLNTSHGADYFRRWHSRKAFSGGLLIHKSTHHFDLINWLLDAIPARVFAFGDLVFYGRKNAVARGQENLTAYDRYTGAPAAASDPFRLQLDQDPTLKARYLDAEADSGYLRDQNVFRDDIDIEDSMSVLIKYRTGEMATYSLNAFCPTEGFRVSLTGDAGRIEYTEDHASHLMTGDKEIKTDGEHVMHGTVQRLFQSPENFTVPAVAGNHGGGDALLQEQMFNPAPPPDPLRRNAGHEQGAASLLVGAAANLSIATGQPVDLGELASLRPAARHLHELI